MHTNPDQLIASLEAELLTIDSLAALEAVRLRMLGKSGVITQLLKNIGVLPLEERPAAGQLVHQIKNAITDRLQARENQLSESAAPITKDAIDVTLSGRGESLGALHPVTRTRMRMEAFFTRYGFDVIEGNEIETDYYNFTALNIPEEHPARAGHDTFYLDASRLLRTHTSATQIHTLEKPDVTFPLRMITPGRVYRRDSDVTHTPMFHQLEGLLVEEGASFAQLKTLLTDFVRYFFERDISVRFRPSYFPFTEPSAEMDIECLFCETKQSSCRICRGTGWLEVLGCGMVHPKVLSVNPSLVCQDTITGYAFGMGIDRFAMLRYGISDLRILFESDLAFLSAFTGA